MAEIPHQEEYLQAQCLLQLKEEGLISRLLFIRWPVVNLWHQVPFISLIPSSNAQALNLLLTFSQRVFLSVYPLFNIEGNFLQKATCKGVESIHQFYGEDPLILEQFQI